MLYEGGFYIQFKCEICGNEDPKYIGYLNNNPYCRKCIQFKGELASDDISYLNGPSKAIIKYQLSQEQKDISKAVLTNFINHKNTLIYAVCGAGKTELVFEVIEYALNHKMKVGFAVPRKDVVIELARRFQTTFKDNIVIALFGGNTSILYGDIICLTTHQLYRYSKYFDLLILDEIDAFPYKGNDVLEAIFKRSVKGNYVLMSATPDEKTLNDFRQNNTVLELFTRYHKKPIPVPKIIIRYSFFKIIFVIRKLKEYENKNLPCFVFAPTIDICESLYSYLKLFFKRIDYVHSKWGKRNEIIDKFREGKLLCLVCTAVLERGVTVKNLQVIIYDADNNIYNDKALLQISGRVGRVIKATSGDVYYVCKKKTEYMEKAIKFTILANSKL